MTKNKLIPSSRALVVCESFEQCVVSTIGITLLEGRGTLREHFEESLWGHVVALWV